MRTAKVLLIFAAVLSTSPAAAQADLFCDTLCLVQPRVDLGSRRSYETQVRCLLQLATQPDLDHWAREISVGNFNRGTSLILRSLDHPIPGYGCYREFVSRPGYSNRVVHPVLLKGQVIGKICRKPDIPRVGEWLRVKICEINFAAPETQLFLATPSP